MCVIILCDKDSGFPALATLESAEQMNSHGGGIAWIENGKVRYKKGIKAKEIFEITKKIQLPAIIHFRIASIGSVKNELCHPFEINEEASTALSGSCDGVLFHNGTWSDWNEICMRAVVSKGIKFPAGDWSDSRAMAWLADKFGVNFLSLIDTSNKIAVLTPEGITKFGRYVEVEKNLCSNDYFDNSFGTGFSGLSGLYKSCNNYTRRFYDNNKTESKSDDEAESSIVTNESKKSKKKKKKQKLSEAVRNQVDSIIKRTKTIDGYCVEADNDVENIPAIDDRIEESITMGNYEAIFNQEEQQRKDREAMNKSYQNAQDEIDDYRPRSFFEQSAIKSKNDRRGNGFDLYY
jgi:hypothetical protein